jgi:hypothetical protein
MLLYPASEGICDEALALCSMCCVCVWRPERADACLAAIAGTTQVPIWPGAVPDPQPVAGPEVTTPSSGKDGLIAGRPVVGVFNVTRPTMTVYSPQGNNTGAAVVVLPGGGYQGLAIDFEGTEVCDWLTPKGITCVLNVSPIVRSRQSL